MNFKFRVESLLDGNNYLKTKILKDKNRITMVELCKLINIE